MRRIQVEGRGRVDRAAREACGWSVAKAASAARVRVADVRAYEREPADVADDRVRLRLERLYDALRTCAGHAA
jgi:ribosome-binding protein aMBF1 (putative translation factor)